MAKAPLTTHPDAQPDVPRGPAYAGAPTSDTPTEHTEAGPIHGALAKAMNDLRNAASAIGPVNYLPDTWPAEEIRALERATEIVLRLVDANNTPPSN